MKNAIPYKLLSKYFSGECTENEQKELFGWRNKSKPNQELFKEMKHIWENSKTPSRFRPDAEKALKHVHQVIDDENIMEYADKRTRNLLPYITRIAASVIIVFGLWLGYKYLISKESKTIIVETTQNIKEISLPDGSVVTLNAFSTLKYPDKFNKDFRKIDFQGEGYFQISKDPGRPFSIFSNGLETKILGTEFNLRAIKSEDVVIVTVNEGKVSLSDNTGQQSKAIILTKGEKGTYNKKSSKIRAEKNLDLNVTSWKTKELTFSRTPLNKVVHDLSNYYNASISIQNSSLDTLLVTIKLTNLKLDEALKLIELTTQTSIDHENKEIIIK